MSKGSRTILFGTCLVAFATSAALAQSPDPSADPAATDPVADPAATTAPDATPPATEEPASRYPRSVIDRPLTFPKGLAAVGVDVSTFTANSTFLDPALIRILAGYGITDDLEIGFGHYAFATSDAGKGSIDANIGYKLLRGAAGGKLEVIARAQTGYSLAAEGMNPLQLGVHAQYNVTPKFAVYTPGQQLSFGLSGAVKPITFSIPVGAAVQAAKTVWIQLDTTLANIKIKDSANAFIFADSTPLALTGIINVMPALDVLAGVSANLTPADTVVGTTTVKGDIADTISLMVGARYYIGKL